MQIAFKIRRELVTNVNFLRLTSSLLPPESGGGIVNPVVKGSYDEAVNFINYANEKQFIELGPKILNAIEPILETAIRNFPPKKDLEAISSSFTELLKEEPELFSFGIPFHWLDPLIDTTNLLRPEIPYQARIGTGQHAGNWSLDEMYFLDDGFFFLVKAERELELLLSLGKKFRETIKEGHRSEEAYFRTRTINLNTCSYGRNSILNLYSFIECFINGIAFDYYLRNKDSLNTREIETLHGRRKGGFLSLEYKLEKYPAIIREDKKQVLHITDPKQLKEPFRTLVTECKMLRDSAMHYAPNKEAVWRRPTDWVEKARKYSRSIIQSAQSFWTACYPDKEFPFYLRDLNYEKCHEGAEKRFSETEEIRATSGTIRETST